MNYLKNLTEQTVKETFDLLGVVDDRSRKEDMVKIRAAISNAMADYVNPTITAEALGRDRTTCIHHVKSHEANLKHWVGYSDTFVIAKEVAHTIMSGAMQTKRRSVIGLRIQALKRKIVELEQELIEIT
jgi:hypothetical protein|tara:strand:+ start:7527 stop:7913 length:387 start_codon:yes stop_codon:yes gene_type:complete